MNTERTVEQICRDFLVSSQVSDDWDATVAEFAKIVSPDIAALRRDAERWRKVKQFKWLRRALAVEGELKFPIQLLLQDDNALDAAIDAIE